MVHSDAGLHLLTQGLQHVAHVPCEDEVTLMSCGVKDDGFLSLHRSGRVRFYTADGHLRDPPVRSTVPYEGVAFTQIRGRLVGWGHGANLTLLDTDLTPLAHTQDALDIRVCQMLKGSQELVTAGAGNVCVWSLSHMVCRVRVVDGFEKEYVFTQLALVPAAAQKAPRALAVCGRSVSVVDLGEGSVLEHKASLHRCEITAVVYCPLQNIMVTAAKDVTMRVWGSDWELLMSFVGHTAPVTSLLFCSLSGLLLSSSLDSTLRYWSIQTGDQVKTMTSPTVSAPPLSVGGPSSMSTFFSFSKSGVDFWTYNSLYQLHCKLSIDSDICPVRQIRATPSAPHYPARVVCVHGDNDVMLMAAGTGAVITAFRIRERVRCAEYCLYREMLMVLTDEGTVIKASTLTNPVTRLDTWTNRENGLGEPCCMALYSHIEDEETALEEWKELQEERGERPRVRKQLEEGKNRFLVMLGHRSGCVSVMQMHSGHVQYKIPTHNGQDITSIQAYPFSGYLLTAGEDNSVLLWRVFPYTEDCLSLQTSVFCAHSPVCMSLLDSVLALGLQQQHSATNCLVQLNLHTHANTPTHTRCDHRAEHDHCSAITGLCVCPNLRVFASCSQDGTLRLWDEKNHLLRTLELNAEPECVQFSGRGGELLLGIKGDVYRIHCTHLLPPKFEIQLLCNEGIYDPVLDLPIASNTSKTESSCTSEVEYSEKQNQTNDADLECLLERNRDLCFLQNGDTHCKRKPRSTSHTRREAFNHYIQLLYKPPPQISIPDEDSFDLHAALFPPKPPKLRPLTPPILQEGFFPNWSLAKKPDSANTQEGVASRPPTAPLGFIPNSVLVGQIWPDDVVQNAVPSTPWSHRGHTRDSERRMYDVQYLDEDEDEDDNMTSVLHFIETSPEPDSPTPPPLMTPPPELPLTEKPGYTLRPLKPLPRIKTTPPPTPPKQAPPTPVRTPTPPLPDFLKQFVQEAWFHSMYPDSGCIPKSLSLAEFCAQLLDFMKRCGVDQKLCVLKAIITLYTHNSLTNTHTVTHSLLDTLHVCLHKNMSDMEQRFVVELLNFLVCVNPHSYDVTVEVLVLLADKELRLQGVAVCMLQALGVDEAHQWLRTQLETWNHEVQKHTDPQRYLREQAHRWLNTWTAQYKIHKHAGKKNALFTEVISPSEVLRYFCWVQKEAELKKRAESGRRNTVVLDTDSYRWKAVHRLGETNSMTRVREPQGSCLPPLTSRPLLTGFTRLLSLPLPRVTLSSFPFCLEARCLKQAPLPRYFLLERSYVQFYR